MNAKRNLSGVAAALLVFSSVALAQDEGPQYTLSSLCGDYGAVVTYGANVAAGFGHEKYDGQGNATGSALANQPGANGTRTMHQLRHQRNLHREQGWLRYPDPYHRIAGRQHCASY